jgi:hypothetical protein
MTEQARPEEKHPIALSLQELGITEAAIVDDAYDPPTVESFDGDEIADFWTAIEREEEMLTELAKLSGSEVKNREDLGNEIIGKLWKGLEESKLGKLSDPCTERLFATMLQKRVDVDTLSGHLKTVGLNVITVGRENGYLPPPTVKLVFLDYVLNPSERTNLGSLATQKAKQMYSGTASDADKPFIILISARPNVEEQKERFREDSGLLGGLFGFIARDDIKHRDKFLLKLYSLGIGSQTHHAIQRFVDTLVEAADETAKAFKEKIRTLDVQDYTFIQRLSLNEDGQPLGDYILWLFESTVGYLFRDHEPVRKQQCNLDKLRFHSYLPYQSQPSTRLAEIYKWALTEPAVQELGPHPLDETGNLPLLHLGDIFIKDANDSLLMVVNAACDLMFSPLGSRKCDPEQPIYFIPGSLEKFHERKNEREFTRTELYEYKGKPYRIIWDHQHVYSVKYETVWNYLRTEGYSRRSRLRLPYALQVQQSFAASLARIGMPVSPPIFESADLEVYCQKENNKLTLIGGSFSEGVVLIHKRDRSDYILTYPCTCKLIDILGEIETIWEGKKSSLALGSKKYESLNKKINGLREWRNKVENWFQMLETPKALPKVGRKGQLQLKEGLLHVSSGRSFEGEDGPPILLNIKFREGPSIDVKQER